MVKTRYIVAVGVAVALAVIVALENRADPAAQRSGPPATQSAAEIAAKNSQRSERGSVEGFGPSPTAPPAPSVASVPAVTLPPPDTKVRDVIAQLKADADRGERHAACRLGAELTRCWQVQQRLALRNSALSRSDEKLPDPASAAIHELCDGVTRSQADDAWRYLLSASLAGSAPAMSQFLASPPLAAQDGSVEGWSAYQHHYKDFLARSIQRGDARALYVGFFSAETGMTPGGREVPVRDPHQALVYGLALLPLVDTRTSQQIQAVLPGLRSAIPDPSKAPEEASLLGARYFSGRDPEDIASAMGTVKPEACSQ